MAPGTTRTPSKRVFSGIRSWWWKSPTLDSSMPSTRKLSRMERLARSSTTTWSVSGSTKATRALPASSSSTAPTMVSRAAVSSGVSSERRSQRSSISAGSGLVNEVVMAWEPTGSGPVRPIGGAARSSRPGTLLRRGSPARSRRARLTIRGERPRLEDVRDPRPPTDSGGRSLSDGAFRRAAPRRPAGPLIHYGLPVHDKPRRRRRERRRRKTSAFIKILVALTIVCGALVAVGVYVIRSIGPVDIDPPVAAGCSVSGDGGRDALEPEQAASAATVSGVAFARDLPEEAVVVAFATVWQETKFFNIDYGDRDSVGLFQQRPSQEWGEPEQIMDPVYASGKFYEHLEKVDGYAEMPVYEAAQQVQRSADGFAYDQHEKR